VFSTFAAKVGFKISFTVFEPV